MSFKQGDKRAGARDEWEGEDECGGVVHEVEGWDKVKEKEEEMVGEELVELLGGSKGVGEKNDTEES